MNLLRILIFVVLVKLVIFSIANANGIIFTSTGYCVTWGGGTTCTNGAQVNKIGNAVFVTGGDVDLTNLGVAAEVGKSMRGDYEVGGDSYDLVDSYFDY